MLNRVRRILTAPIFPDDEDKTRKAFYANAIALTFLIITIAWQGSIRLMGGYRDVSLADLMVFGLTAACVVALVMLRRGSVYASSMLLVIFIWGTVNSVAATGYGVKDASFVTNFTVVLMAGLLLNWQASLIITILSIISGFGLALAEQNGRISHPVYPIMSSATDMAYVFVFNIVIIRLLINGLETALRRSRANAEKLATTNVDLSNTQSELQQRSDELVVVNKQLENRTGIHP
jgi:hypothetical protein